MAGISVQWFPGGFGGVATTQKWAHGRENEADGSTLHGPDGPVAPTGLEGGQAVGMADNETKLAYQGLPEALELGTTRLDGDRCHEPVKKSLERSGLKRGRSVELSPNHVEKFAGGGSIECPPADPPRESDGGIPDAGPWSVPASSQNTAGNDACRRGEAFPRPSLRSGLGIPHLAARLAAKVSS